MRLKQLRQDLAAGVAEANVILTPSREQKRAISGEERAAYDAVMAKVSGIRSTIEVEEQQLDIDRTIAEQRGEHQERTGVHPDQAREAFRSMLRMGSEHMTPEQRALLIPGAHTSMNLRGNPQSAVTGNLGQYTIPQGFYPEIQAALKFYSGMMESGAFILNTESGNDLPIPTSNDTTNMGVELAENQTVTNVEVPFGVVTMKAYKYSSNIILTPIELLQDTGVDIEAFFKKALATRIGRILNLRFTSGTGTNQPRGVLLDSTTGVTTSTGVTGHPSYANLVSLKYSVNRAYRRTAKWMMNDATLAYLLTLVDGQQRPLILDYLNTLQADEPEKILGQSIVINNDMPDIGTAGSPVLGNQFMIYGAFENYWIRMVMNLVILRLVERYADAGQVGFIGFMRADGRMVDAGTHPIKALVSATT